ncbi:MAG TPA: tetratricopeptide repeat protein [Steroidobacteraceae bacterium]|nr:tetratricopeptide repeat protein [Steroidobacteraceae bacterium]
MTSHSDSLQRAAAALQGGDPELARRTCEALLNKNPRDVAVIHLRGRCLAAMGSMAGAVEDFRRALTIAPNHFQTLADLGIALAALGRHEEAADRLATALAQDDRPAELHFALGQSRLECGDLRAAAQSLTAAIARRPQFADAYISLGVVFDRAGDSANAMRCFEQARSIEPKLSRAHRNLADMLRRGGRPEDAVRVLQQAAAARPDDPELLCELSESFCDVGRWEDGLAAARAAISQEARNARAHAAAGMALLGADQCAAAAELLERALSLDPGLAYAAVNWGEALLRVRRPEEAADAYRKALSIAGAMVEAHIGLSRALTLLGDLPTATRCLQNAHAARPADAAIAIMVASRLENIGSLDAALLVHEDSTERSPSDASVHHAFAGFLHRRGRLEEALASYERALGIAPDHPQTIVDQAYALESLGRLADAAAAFERVLTLKPDSTQALAGAVSCAFRRCEWERVESAWAALEALPDGLDALHPFLLLAAGTTPAKQLRVLERRARQIEQPVAARLGGAIRHSHSRLRVAYLSPDFREHAVAHAIVSVIENHDRSRVQPIGVSLMPADRSVVGARLRSAFEVVLDAAAMSDREVVERLRELEIDIAIDLAGFTTGARTGILAARCAPVQVNFLGFPSTMGTPFMDYIIADEVVLPVTDEAAYSERVLRLPHCYLPLDTTRVIPDAVPDRASVGLPTHGTVFCGFNNSYKITREMFRVWLGLLREVPGSVLWLRSMSADATENLRRAADEWGVARSRLIFAAYSERMDEYLARLRLADLFLDTLPYNAHTTAADALWAGVPVVSCRGDSFAGRVGASLLTAAGLPDLVCGTLDEYRSKALRLATRPGELQAVRHRVQSARSAPLFDIPSFTRNLEALYAGIGLSVFLGPLSRWNSRAAPATGETRSANDSAARG